MKREIVEVCPHCEAENYIEWDLMKNGYVVKCNECGKEMMLCDECRHVDDNLNQICDGKNVNGEWVCFRGKHKW